MSRRSPRATQGRSSAASEVYKGQILPWIGAVGALSLHLLFYLALTVFLGTVFSSRGAVVGIAIGVFFVGLFLGPALPDSVADFLPVALVEPLAMELVDETRSVDSILPVFATMAWVALFTVAAFWRFQREEF